MKQDWPLALGFLLIGLGYLLDGSLALMDVAPLREAAPDSGFADSLQFAAIATLWQAGALTMGAGLWWVFGGRGGTVLLSTAMGMAAVGAAAPFLRWWLIPRSWHAGVEPVNLAGFVAFLGGSVMFVMVKRSARPDRWRTLLAATFLALGSVAVAASLVLLFSRNPLLLQNSMRFGPLVALVQLPGFFLVITRVALPQALDEGGGSSAGPASSSAPPTAPAFSTPSAAAAPVPTFTRLDPSHQERRRVPVSTPEALGDDPYEVSYEKVTVECPRCKSVQSIFPGSQEGCGQCGYGRLEPLAPVARKRTRKGKVGRPSKRRRSRKRRPS